MAEESLRAVQEGEPIDDKNEKAYEDLSQKHVHFRLENSVLSDHLTRLITRKGSGHLHLQLEALEEDIKETEDESAARRTSRSSMRLPIEEGAESSVRDSTFQRSSQHFSLKEIPNMQPEVVIPLSLEEKCEIVEDEVAAIREQINRCRGESERMLDDLKAVIQETDLSIAEIKKEKKSFQREVMFEAELRSSNFASSDRILSYLQDKIKAKHIFIMKLQNKNDSLQTQVMDAERQFATKKDLADVLHAVDFDQLTILNQQLVSKLRDRTHEFHKLKANNIKVSKALETVQTQLIDAEKEGRCIKRQLVEDLPKLKDAKEKLALVFNQKEKSKELLSRNIQEATGPPPPNAVDYMCIKKKVQSLHNELRCWRNKVEIADMTAGQLERKLQLQKKQTCTDAKKACTNSISCA